MAQKIGGRNRKAGNGSVVIPTTRECHKCPLNLKGDDYCWKHCKGPSENSRKGKSIVSLGGINADGEFIRDNLGRESAQEQDERSANFVYFDEPQSPASEERAITKELDAQTERGLSVILANLFNLSDIHLCILRHLLFGEDYATIGRTIPKPMSKEAVHKNIVKMSSTHPFVLAVMKQMQISGKGGARRKQAYNMEFDFTR